MPYLVLLVYFATRVTSAITVKSNSRSFSVYKSTGSFLYIIETSLFSLFFYWALNGFKLSVNPTVTLYAAIYGAIVVCSLTISIFVYNYGSLAMVNFITSTVSLISAMLSGMILFDEVLTPDKLLRLGLMFVCTVIILLGARKNAPHPTDTEQKKRKGVHPLALILPALTAILGTGTSVLIKSYSGASLSTDSNSLFFMTNVFSFAYSIPIIFLTMRKNKVSPREIVQICADKRSAIALATTAIGSIQAIATALLLEAMDVAVYTPVTNAIGFIALAIATPIVREKLDRYTVCATIVSVLSIILPVVLF